MEHETIDKWHVFRFAELVAELAGNAGTKLDDSAIELLADAVNWSWEAINPHNSMELFAMIAIRVGDKNATRFVKHCIHALENRSDYAHEIATNSAGHCLVAAVLTNDLSDLLSEDLIRSQVDYLSSYGPSNSGYNELKISVLKNNIAAYRTEEA